MEYPYCPTLSAKMTTLAFGRCVTCLLFCRVHAGVGGITKPRNLSIKSWEGVTNF